MFVFDYSEDLDIATYEYRIYQANQVEADTAHSGYYKLINAATIDSGTIAPYSQGFNLSNVFTVAVENSTTTSSSTTTSPISYYGAIRPIDTSANLGPWTLITKTSTDTPLIDQQFIGSLTAAKITTGTLGAAEITLNGANSIIKSSNYSAGSLGWKITGLGDAEFNDLTVRTALDIGGSDASSFHVDVNGNLWLGASTYGSAPFKVSNTGALTATGANISGAITATSGSFTGKITVPGTNTQFGKNINDAANYQGIKVGGLAGEWKNAWVERADGSVYFNAQNVAGTNRFYMDSTDSLLSMGNGVFSVTNAGAVTASSVTITGGTVGGVNTSSNKLFLGVGNYNNNDTPFFAGLHSGVNKFSLGAGLTWDGSTLAINGGGTFTGTLQVGNVEIGNDVGPGTGHYGISLSTTDFNNIFLRRYDGVYFFRVGNGGSNSLTWDSSSGVLNVTGAITATSGTFNGRLQAGDIYIPNTSSPVFSVTTGGAVTATSGTIAGWSFTGSQFSSGGTVLNSNGTITIGVNSDAALRLNSGSDITMYAAAGGTSSIYYYRDGYATNQWDSQLSQSAAGNLIVYGNDFNNNFYPTFIVRSYAYSGAEVRSWDNATTSETLAVTRAHTSTSAFNADMALATGTQMLQFFKRNQNNANTAVGYIRAFNGSTVPSFVGGSDERLKNDIEVYSTPLIQDIKNINVYDWYDKDDIYKKNKVIGFLAKEFYPKYTTVIIGKPDEIDDNGDPVYMRLSREDLIPHMFGVIKHLVNKVDELERKIENV